MNNHANLSIELCKVRNKLAFAIKHSRELLFGDEVKVESQLSLLFLSAM